MLVIKYAASDVAYTPLMFAKVIITPEKLYLFINPARISPEIIKERPEITILPEEEFENILKDQDNIFIDDSIASIHIMDLITDKKVHKIKDPCLMLKACKNEVEIKHAINFHIKDAVALCEFFADLEESSHCKKTQSVDEAISGEYEEIATQSATARNDEILNEYTLGLKLTEYRAKQGAMFQIVFRLFVALGKIVQSFIIELMLKPLRRLRGRDIAYRFRRSI